MSDVKRCVESVVREEKREARALIGERRPIANVGWTDASRAGAYLSRMKKIRSGFAKEPVREVVVGTNPVRHTRPGGVQAVVVREAPKPAVVKRNVVRVEMLNPGQRAKLKAIEEAAIARWGDYKKQRFNDQRPPPVGWEDPLKKK
jgi:hypothetical protein